MLTSPNFFISKLKISPASSTTFYATGFRLLVLLVLRLRSHCKFSMFFSKRFT